ncbi:atpase aaa : Uncharacterized protein OS=Cyanothece sp. CCY0110 GN=CY0110_04458 PE=4 SV=1: AAA_21 [Gemmata massiliana]|uniref:Uncharacterized protein n=1 Tax=Gemmata massiliana TaxID=1210884 RepID=A0A6P2DES8_9BACT|nr:ATP-binding protein [Gemmata massiliana]VTR99219.1 atpase aaa : Uncharacterized protein OS=Cyanothece sp. CCY0110 GN=CY0110_04458 PE=4 SV=1: AAA_21 [Gemmata massiliana]
MLSSEGDGVRSFAGVIINLFAPEASIVLLDEPEAFLHPPQCRLLGRILAREQERDVQLFVATHSGDILRGLLDENTSRLRILRLQRGNNTTEIRELNAERIREYWNDPLIRYSNILDGIFHEKVILCEGDSDNRFYAAILDTLWSQNGKELRRPDVMFAHCGGKSRLPMVVEALRKLGVPIAVVADFDILNNAEPLKSLCDKLGAQWSEIEKHWRVVKTEIDKKKPSLDMEDLKKEILNILNSISSPTLPSADRRKIENELKRSSPWTEAKCIGRPYIPSGDATNHANQLFSILEKSGLYIVPVGEVEGWVKSIGNHGPLWVNNVLENVDLNKSEYDQARDFVRKIVENKQ